MGELFMCCPVSVWETMPAELRALAEREDAPYQRIDCPSCRAPMLLSKQGRAMLADGRAKSTICSTCAQAIIMTAIEQAGGKR